MSAYQRAYLLWYLRSRRKEIMMYAGVLIVIIAMPMWLVSTAYPQELVINEACITLALNLLGALIIPVLQFRYLLDQRAADLYLPLPIKRKQLFFMQFGLGLILLWLPNFVFLAAMLGNGAALSYVGGYSFLMLVLMFFTFVQYSIDTFLVMQCHNRIDAILAMVGFLLAQLLLVATISGVLDNTVHHVLTGGGSLHEFFPQWLYYLLSPVMSAVNSISALSYITTGENLSFNIALWQEYSGIDPLYIAAAAALAFAAINCAMRAYERAKGENSEQKTTSKWIYPLLITLVSGCLIFVNILSFEYFILTVILYFVMNFVAQRKIAVQPGMVVRFMVLAIAALGISRLLIDTKGFGLIHELYDRNELAQVRVEITFNDMEDNSAEAVPETKEPQKTDYLIMGEHRDDEWLLDHVYALQTAISGKHENAEASAAFIQVNYVLKNQQQVYRYYTVDQQHEKEIQVIADYLLAHDYVME